MKVLLDENMPHLLRHDLVGHDVATVAEMGWNGLTNDVLLKQAASVGFDVMITINRGIENQHNLDELPLAIIAIAAPTNTVEVLHPLVTALPKVLQQREPKSLLTLDVGSHPS